MGLREKVLERKKNLKLAEGKERGDFKLILDKKITVDNFVVAESDEYGKYVIFTCKEQPDQYFMNGGQVVVDAFTHINDLKEEVEAEGLPTLISKVTGKNKREYNNVEFYPDEK